MCFRLRRIRDSMAVKERKMATPARRGWEREKLKARRPGTRRGYLMYCTSCMGGGPLEVVL